jgi:hypothetical protein
MVVILPMSLLAADSASAILHTQGGVLVNGNEAHDSLSIMPGDSLETKAGFRADLDSDGSSVLIQQQSVVQFQANQIVLEHGSVLVATAKGMSVRVNCLVVVPVSNEWTQYEVTDVNGTVQVFARKSDVRINRESNRGKQVKEPKEPDSSSGAIVHEGEQSNREESVACGGAWKPTSAGSLPNPKWIAAAGGGGGLLLWLLLHGGPQTPLSSSTP